MALAASLEKRVLNTELRTKGRRLEGYAALFGQEARIEDQFTESICYGAFTRSIKSNGDILALVDHDPTSLLARTKSGSLRLSEDKHGLAFDLDVPETQKGHDILALAQRGDLGGMSFGFKVPRGGELRNGDNRQLIDVDLFEISVVQAFPAYEGTVVNARSIQTVAPVYQNLSRRLRVLELAK
ncbi:MAG: HK97 family phage prohead protease [Aquisalinus sp.]|nr:HK97 family phage prohead protease [Aquisalinus sp.]